MNWKRRLLENFRLYAVTNLKEDDTPFLKKVEEALAGGVDILQLRAKTLSDAEFIRIGLKVRELADKYGKLFTVNDRADLVSVLDADGVHVGQEDLPVGWARKVMGDPSKMVGKSTHSRDEAREAQEEGVDYIGIGPIFPTPTKPTYVPVGLDLIRELHHQITIPFVAIGGIDAGNIASVLEAGASRVAVVRAIFDASDVLRATRELRTILDQHEMPLLQV